MLPVLKQHARENCHHLETEPRGENTSKKNTAVECINFSVNVVLTLKVLIFPLGDKLLKKKFPPEFQRYTVSTNIK